MNRFEKSVCATLGNWGVTPSGYFYAKPARRLISGFTLETTPSFRRICRYTWPICDRLPLPYLSFGGRLNVAVPKRLDASDFVFLVAPFVADALSLADPRMFIDRFPVTISRGPVLRRGIACVLAALSLFDQAQEQLEICLADKDRPAKPPGHDEDTLTLLHAVSSKSESSVAKVLDEWEAETKVRFGIS